MRLSTVVALSVGLWAGTVALPARAAGEPLRLALSVDGPCAREALERSLAEGVRRRIVIDDEADARLSVHFAREHGRFSARAWFQGASGADVRTLSGSACSEIVIALALVSSTWLEAEPREATSRKASPAGAEQAPSAAIRFVPDVTDVRDAENETPKEASRDLALGAVSLVGVRGTAAFGTALSAGMRRGRLAFRAGLRGLTASETAPAPLRAHRWATVVVEACYEALEGAKVSVSGCGRLDPGVVVSQLEGAVAAAAPWLSASAGPRISSGFERLRFELEVLAVLPVIGSALGREGANGVFQAAALAVQGGAGAALRFE